MAETKAKKSRAKKRASGSASKVKSKAGASDSGSNGSGSIADSVKHGAQGAINGTAPVLQKVKVPLVAGGAAAAGIAGAVLASRAGGKRKVLGVSVPKRSKVHLPKNGFKPDVRKVTKGVTDAARRADDFGQGVSRIASSVKKVGEAADEAAKKS